MRAASNNTNLKDISSSHYFVSNNNGYVRVDSKEELTEQLDKVRALLAERERLQLDSLMREATPLVDWLGDNPTKGHIEFMEMWLDDLT